MSETNLKIKVISFGYKYDDMPEANLVLDLRFLTNPFWDPKMREMSGLDQSVYDYVMNVPGAEETYQSFFSLVERTLPLFREKAKLKRQNESEVVIAFGCTGGQHRSVAFAERLSEDLVNESYDVQTIHRDLETSLKNARNGNVR